METNNQMWNINCENLGHKNDSRYERSIEGNCRI